MSIPNDEIQKDGFTSILNDIQKDALDSSVDIASLLRKCMVLAVKLGNRDFHEWINHELFGYQELDDLPDYRIRTAASYGHFTTGGAGMWQNLPISYYPVPKELLKEATTVYFTQSISSLEQMVKNSKDGSLSFSWNPDVISILRDKFYKDYTCISAYKHISTSTIAEIISIVRTKALEFVLEIQKNAPDAQDAPPKAQSLSDKQITQIFFTTIMGDGQILASGSSGINQLTQSSYQIHQGDWESLIKCLAELGINDFVELKKAMDEDKDSIGNRTKDWIKEAAGKVASGTRAISIAVASELLSKAISTYFGIPS
jgi:hypothetical protein